MRFRVEDESMCPTLKADDYLLVNKISKKFSVGDIIVLDYAEKFLVKRIKKISGEKIFVTGDNTSVSSKLDFIAVDQIIGKVFMKVKK